MSGSHFCGLCFALFILSVRDAAARLPNGEGTRAEICKLLKESQFLAPDVTTAQVSRTRAGCATLSVS